MALVKPHIQAALVATVEVALMAQGISIPVAGSWKLVTSTSICDAITVMEAYSSSDGRWEPVVNLATMLVEELKGKLERGMSENIEGI
jgi:hypothetical protein